MLEVVGEASPTAFIADPHRADRRRAADEQIKDEVKQHSVEQRSKQSRQEAEPAFRRTRFERSFSGWTAAGLQDSQDAVPADRRSSFERCFSKYDTDKSGWLELNELRNLLTDIDASTPAGTCPSDEEVLFILRVVHSDRQDALSLEYLGDAVVAWDLWLQERSHYVTVLKEYDTDATGKLDFDQLKRYLESLSAGASVSDQEVTWVLQEADLFGDGALNSQELTIATSAWKQLRRKRAAREWEARQEAHAAQQEAMDLDALVVKANKSCVCVVA